MKKYILIICYLLLLSIGVNAQDIYGTARNEDTLYLDPNDFEVGQVLAVDTVNGEKVFVGRDSVTGVSNEPDVDYLYLRAILKQKTGLYSNKLNLFSTDQHHEIDMTIADTFSLSMSSRVSAGIYKLQFLTHGTGQFADLITEESAKGWNSFESKVYPLFGHYVYNDSLETDVWTEELYGYLVFPAKPNYGDDYPYGILSARTYDANWVLSDNILKDGVVVELKCFNK